MHRAITPRIRRARRSLIRAPCRPTPIAAASSSRRKLVQGPLEVAYARGEHYEFSPGRPATLSPAAFSFLFFIEIEPTLAARAERINRGRQREIDRPHGVTGILISQPIPAPRALRAIRRGKFNSFPGKSVTCRHCSDNNGLIGVGMIYQYHTSAAIGFGLSQLRGR